ncbi:16S rRNA (cytosine(967)-C(5))-methyltransferase RsmB [Salinisphaera sp. Q1T1-3]|uniref:16S rRNA (cytosine(967)-C(5))-methyltransferase RsmB n=1 Tax=Salinisphaera sp. Q1T1-3 TaxID=2321229 RepID=UPI000E738A7D|nr:16S rRNA (cytosine(967)-C(5))-methyltransferase RsmB [Salinisphaera sp. Q1T1-3]RJS91254.1 16S rRNA (cytosine(967)-C(5))-methyltransferase RsmB [Salinisphaera sp. Q1T1-3]
MAAETADAGARPRALAARAVAGVIDQGQSLDAALAAWPSDLSGADLALARMMAYGTLRDYRRLGALLAPRLKKTPQPVLDALLRVGLFQLEATRVPAHAAVHATVAATKSLKLSKARGLVNAVLRGHQREPVRLGDEAAVGVMHSYPDWLVERIAADWGAAATEVLAAGNDRAPMHLRVNRRRTTRDAMLAEWRTADLSASPMTVCADGATLAAPVAAERLPGFAEGRVSIQDGAAQIAADLLAAHDGQRVLDACAAPGNKSAHLCERADIALTALDIDAGRLATLEATLARLGLSATTRVGDAAEPAAWWNGEPFDRILLDAPCSGTGVIRRHPDIKWLRRATDIDTAAVRQRRLLEALWPTLAHGGRLVYATCSILAAEGDDIVQDFVAATPDASALDPAPLVGQPTAFGQRIAPGAHDLDGFYYAVLVRE